MELRLDTANNQKDLELIRYITSHYDLLRIGSKLGVCLFLSKYVVGFLMSIFAGLPQIVAAILTAFIVVIGGLFILSIATHQDGTINFSTKISGSRTFKIFLFVAVLASVGIFVWLLSVVGVYQGSVFVVGIALVYFWAAWKDSKIEFWLYQFLILFVMFVLITPFSFLLDILFSTKIFTSFNSPAIAIALIYYVISMGVADYFFVRKVFRYRPFKDNESEPSQIPLIIPENMAKKILTLLSACESADLLILQRLTGVGERTLEKMLYQMEDSGLLQIKHKQLSSKTTQLLMSITTKGRETL